MWEHQGYLKGIFCQVNSSDEVQSSTHDVQNKWQNPQGGHRLHSVSRDWKWNENQTLVKVCSIIFNILLENTTITLCGFKHFQNLPPCSREDWSWIEIPIFVVVLQDSVLHTSKSSGVFLDKSTTDFSWPIWHQCLLWCTQIILCLFQQMRMLSTPQVSRKARGFHHPKGWGRA